jgi:hypothetical protein
MKLCSESLQALSTPDCSHLLRCNKRSLPPFSSPTRFSRYPKGQLNTTMGTFSSRIKKRQLTYHVWTAQCARKSMTKIPPDTKLDTLHLMRFLPPKRGRRTTTCGVLKTQKTRLQLDFLELCAAVNKVSRSKTNENILMYLCSQKHEAKVHMWLQVFISLPSRCAVRTL